MSRPTRRYRAEVLSVLLPIRGMACQVCGAAPPEAGEIGPARGAAPRPGSWAPRWVYDPILRCQRAVVLCSPCARDALGGTGSLLARPPLAEPKAETAS